MPKMMSHYTDLARRDIGPDVIAAVPSRRPLELTWSGNLKLRIAPIQELILAVHLHLFRRRLSAHQQAQFVTVYLVLHADHVTVHRRRFFRRTLRPAIGRASYADSRYQRTAVTTETIWLLDDTPWAIQGWFERDLRAVLRTLGHADALEDV